MFLHQVFEIIVYFKLTAPFTSHLAIFQVVNSYISIVATVVDSTAGGNLSIPL